MDAPSLENKVLTENPLLDEIIYNIRQMCTGTVLKDQEEADNNETLESAQNGDILVAIDLGRIQFAYFNYDSFLLSKIPALSEDKIAEYAADNTLIPDSLKDTLLNLAMEDFQSNYIETNNYYRRLHGVPNKTDGSTFEGIWIDVNTIEEGVISQALSATYVSDEGTDYRLIHELGLGYTELLYDNGTIDDILTNTTRLSGWGIEKNEVLYLNHLGNRSIDYATARGAEKFELLYCPTPDSTEVANRYKDLLEANRLYLLYTTYSEAMKFQSEYYDKFMMIFIVIQTMIDLIVELPEYIIRRDIFDARTCQYIFESNGVEYFPDIPLKYQVALVKNLNKLIKFKSSDKCIVDIISIFGVKNMQVFKYYILKSRNVNSSTDLKYLYTETESVDSDGKTVVEEDIDEDYDLRFVKVPIGDYYDNYIRTANNVYTYDSLVDGDDYWTGDKDYQTVKSAIKNMDFNVLRSKYYGVEAVIDLTQRNFTLTYFMNILLYNKIDKSALLVSMPNISTREQFELVDVILVLYSLSYIYYGVEDTIQRTGQNIAQVLGFNLEADLAKIDDYLYEHHERMSMKTLGVDEFTLPTDGSILSYNELENLYFNNKDIYDHVIEVLKDPPSKEIYDCYKYIYKSLFIMEYNLEYYKKPNGEMAETYREFLRYKSPTLYNFLESDIMSIRDTDSRQTACVNAIQSITTYLKDYIDQDMASITDIFPTLPSISLDFIKDYVEEVIDFFKSFKIFTHDSSIMYYFTDKFENTVQILDWCDMRYTLDKGDIFKIEDWIKNNSANLTAQEKIELVDKVYLVISTWVQKYYTDYYNSDKYAEFTQIIRDYKEYMSTFDVEDTSLRDKMAQHKIAEMLVNITLMTDMDIYDSTQLSATYWIEDYYQDWMFDIIKEYIVSLEYNENYFMLNRLNRYTKLTMRSWLLARDNMRGETVSMNLLDKTDAFMQDECYLIQTVDVY